MHNDRERLSTSLNLLVSKVPVLGRESEADEHLIGPINGMERTRPLKHRAESDNWTLLS